MPDPKFPGKKILDPKDPNPCSGCSNCCEYVSLEIDRPTTLNDYDQIIWYLIHRDIWIYIDHDSDWYIQFNTVCDKLENQRCGYYHHRPMICRDYKVDECIRYGDDESEKFLFKNEVELFQFLAKNRPKTFERLRKKNNIPFSIDELLERKTA